MVARGLASFIVMVKILLLSDAAKSAVLQLSTGKSGLVNR